MIPDPKQEKSRRVLIASSHALFGQGLRSLLQERHPAGVEVVGMVSSLDEALSALEKLSPDLIIVDYDDQVLNRDEFLARFVEGETKLRVVLLSLQSGKEAIVYDRRTLAASQIDNWLEEWSVTDELPRPPIDQKVVDTKAEYRRVNMKHFIIAAVLVIIVAALVAFGLYTANQAGLILPVEASRQGEPIDQLFRIEAAVIAFLFSLIVVLMVYSIVVFRRKRGDTTDAAHVEGNTNLEVAWTIAPLITVLVFAYLGSGALAETMRADPQPLDINVIGQQWAWRFEYPEYGVVSDVLMMPVDKQALLHLSSNDVIHSFWVPEFRVKQDALPGGPKFVRDLRVTPKLLGEYTLRCAELCGKQHSTMQSAVLVVSAADFDSWIARESGISDDPVERGKGWSQKYGCVACHSVDGKAGAGPSWLGIYGSQGALTDGSQVTADDAYLVESIVNPNAKVVQGFQPGIMPQTFGQQMSEQQILDIIEYIKTLK